ncbi:short-subunit dehydrogenase [Stackebrandtia albiflava]|uniref:Short-subunit dehydrogenase n=1 Tax=Stackebrandtia albiflava TaxID=406432 RepID=A0A562V3B4_9ACTN|nr:SDR family NAD(P)-dependent oxidoreductase [Stackebrandtia albiflava]TWJ12348.1 short-subunit dehydrogenase [Stackebrandtia albiflava]
MPLSRPLSESVVVVTGASSGLGAAIAGRLAASGCRLVLAARGTDTLHQVAVRCRERGAEVLEVPADVADQAAVARLAVRAEERFGRVDGWIHNAAVAEYGPLLDLPIDDIRRVMDVNLFGALHCAREAVPRMRRHGGVLVFIGSVLAETTVPFQGAYTISKHGLAGLAGTLRQEAGSDSTVSVCLALPSSLDTPLFRHAGNLTGRQPRPIPPANPPDRVAGRVVRLLTSPRDRVYLGRAGRTVGWGSRLAPGLTERVLRQVGLRQFTPGERPAPTRGNLSRPSPGPAHVGGGWRLTGLAAGAVFTAGLAARTLYRLVRS